MVRYNRVYICSDAGRSMHERIKEHDWDIPLAHTLQVWGVGLETNNLIPFKKNFVIETAMRTTSTLHEGIPRSSNHMNASSDVNPDFRHFKAHQLTSHYPLRNELKFIDRDSHWYTCRSHLNFTRANNINIYRNKAIEVTHLHKEHF